MHNAYIVFNLVQKLEGSRYVRRENRMEAMERVTTKQAAAELNMDLETLQYLLRKEKLPIGYAVKREGKKRAVNVNFKLDEDVKKRPSGSV